MVGGTEVAAVWGEEGDLLFDFGADASGWAFVDDVGGDAAHEGEAAVGARAQCRQVVRTRLHRVEYVYAEVNEDIYEVLHAADGAEAADRVDEAD